MDGLHSSSQVKVLIEKTDVSQRRGSSVSRLSSKCSINSYYNLYPTRLPWRYGFASLHSHMSQFLKINLSHISHIYVYIHIYVHIPIHTHIPTHTHTHTHPIGFLSLETSDWYTSWCKSLAKQRMCKSIGYMEFAINSIVYIKIVCELYATHSEYV